MTLSIHRARLLKCAWMMVLFGCGDLSVVDPPDAACPIGAIGCACPADGVCDEADPPLECLDGVCALSTCPEATDGCACTEQGFCAAGLVCADATCSPRLPCPAGSIGCACDGVDRCDAGLVCDDAACVPIDCPRGENGCRCGPGDACEDGLICAGAICEPDIGQTVVAPANPKCFTPCRGDLTLVDGTVRGCGADGLLEGCIGEAVCALGTCVAADLADMVEKTSIGPGSCGDETDCPLHQTCIQGRCFSDCDVDADCRGERRCMQRVCRQTCVRGEESDCAEGWYCAGLAADATEGRCLALMSGQVPSGQAQDVIPATPFVATPPIVDFTVSQTESSVRIQPLNLLGFESFPLRISKLAHTTFADGDAEVDADDPLFWLSVGTDGVEPERVRELTVDVPVGGLDIIFTGADNADIDRWEGVILLEAPSQSFVLNLRFARSPEGQWTGQMIGFADFPATGLDAWQANPDDQALVRQVDNAFIRRWAAFRAGQLSTAEFIAVLQATQNESWRNPLVQASCPPNGPPDPNARCYPFDNPAGLGVYTSSARDTPIPAGASGLPFVANIRATAEDPQVWTGRVVSSSTLHYGGDPEVRLTFEDPPESCSREVGGTCLTFLSSIAVDAAVGARHLTVGSDFSCSAFDGQAELLDQPWLVPGFEANTDADPATGGRVRFECRDAEVPFGPGDANVARNLAFASANPFTDGLPRLRRLRLIDGALVDQSLLFLIYEERHVSFLANGDDLVTYGYLLLGRSTNQPSADEFEGNAVPMDAAEVESGSRPQLHCDAALLDAVFPEQQPGVLANVPPERLDDLAIGLVTGVLPAVADAPVLNANSAEQVHSICWPTGYIDGGPLDDGPGPRPRFACPGSGDGNLTFFTLTGDAGVQANIAALACQQGGGRCRLGEPCAVNHCVPSELCVGELCESRGLCAQFSPCPAGTACQEACATNDPDAACPSKGQCGAFVRAQIDDPLSSIGLNPMRENAGGCLANRSDVRQGCRFLQAADTPFIRPGGSERVHYLCHDTGFFDGGPDDDGSANATRIPCPPTSQVTYFSVRNEAGQDDIAQHACQTRSGPCRRGEPCSMSDLADFQLCVEGDVACAFETTVIRALAGGCTSADADVVDCPVKGDCERTLAGWLNPASRRADIRSNVASRCCRSTLEDGDDDPDTCEDPAPLVCPTDPFDRRRGRIFHAQAPERVRLQRVTDVIDDAFRYRVRFRNRAGLNIGFTPDVCAAGGNLLPYCYDPQAVETVRKRVDCATLVYTERYDDLNADARATLLGFLRQSFSATERRVPGLALPVIEPGFERLYAELLILLGDEALNDPFSSRFDLAGLGEATFEGDRFEPGGERLSGAAGFELFNLYLSVQYYQVAIDRLATLSAPFAASIDSENGLPAGEGFLTAATVSTWLDRLVQASTQKATAWAQIAAAWSGVNRPDLARQVLERAYTQAYLESVLLTRLMVLIADELDESARGPASAIAQRAQLRYDSALASMRMVLADVSEVPDFLGIPLDAVPFPPLGTQDANAFDVAFGYARQRADVALDRERRAIEDSRAFETDAGLFQNQLSQIEFDFDQQLIQICGSFVGEDDGVVYPAIPENADRSARTRLLGDPCGLLEDGDLSSELVNIRDFELQLDGVELEARNTEAELDDLQTQVSAQCDRIMDLRTMRASINGEILTMQSVIDVLQVAIDAADRSLNAFGTTLGLAGAKPLAAAFAGTAIAAIPVQAIGEGVIAGLQAGIAVSENEIADLELLTECNALQIDGVFEIARLFRRFSALHLETAQIQNQLQGTSDTITGLNNEALMIRRARSDMLQLAINTEVARNDPNVRIFRNAAVISADRTFRRALREAFRATRVFEYYTSQSYGPRNDLFLVRLVSAGAPSLSSYLDDLEDAFIDFEEQFGIPDLRVLRVSVRDQILPLTKMDENGRALSTAERVTALREALSDPARRDANGYLTLPFETTEGVLSPLTNNHKVLAVEAEFVGEDLGDDLGRLYLRQSGTSTVLGADGSRHFMIFPPRTAVLNTFFNGDKTPLNTNVRVDGAPADIYRNVRLRDRPLLNTRWELVFNQRDEAVNQDIPVANLQDIALYIFYTDFTEL